MPFQGARAPGNSKKMPKASEKLRNLCRFLCPSALSAACVDDPLVVLHQNDERHGKPAQGARLREPPGSTKRMVNVSAVNFQAKPWK